MGISQTNFKNILKTFSALFLTKHPVNKIIGCFLYFLGIIMYKPESGDTCAVPALWINTMPFF